MAFFSPSGSRFHDVVKVLFDEFDLEGVYFDA